MTTATVITDASFCHMSNVGAWAAVVSSGLFGPKKRLMKSGVFPQRVRDSSDAEFMAAVNGVAVAISCGATDILLQSDLITVVEDVHIRKHWAWKAVDLSEIKIRAKHVKGHTKKRGAKYLANDWCDRESRKLMRAERKKRAVKKRKMKGGKCVAAVWTLRAKYASREVYHEL